MRAAAVLGLLAAALPALASAGAILGAGEFERLSTGKTLYFTQAGRPYGVEQYAPGRQVVWQYADGTCDTGYWYQERSALCFVYDSNPEPQCWIFEARDGDFFARVEGAASGDPSELRLAGESDAPLVCQGPDLGV